MKAVILNKFGPVNNLILTDIPVSHIGNDEVLIKVNALSINPVDLKMNVLITKRLALKTK